MTINRFEYQIKTTETGLSKNNSWDNRILSTLSDVIISSIKIVNNDVTYVMPNPRKNLKRNLLSTDILE